jgi:hypothetical protein
MFLANVNVNGGCGPTRVGARVVRVRVRERRARHAQVVHEPGRWFPVTESCLTLARARVRVCTRWATSARETKTMRQLRTVTASASPRVVHLARAGARLHVWAHSRTVHERADNGRPAVESGYLERVRSSGDCGRCRDVRWICRIRSVRGVPGTWQGFRSGPVARFAHCVRRCA